MYQVEVAEVEALTGLSMTAFRRVDTKAAQQRLSAGAVRQPARPIRSFADVIR